LTVSTLTSQIASETGIRAGRAGRRRTKLGHRAENAMKRLSLSGKFALFLDDGPGHSFHAVFEIVSTARDCFEFDQDRSIASHVNLEKVRTGLQIQIPRTTVKISCPPDKSVVEVDPGVLGPHLGTHDRKVRTRRHAL
jgi:hypothetical protein